MKSTNFLRALFYCWATLLILLFATSCTEIEFLKTSSGEDTEDPKIVMENMESHITNKGVLEKKIIAQKAVYNENQQKAALNDITAIFYDAGEELGVLTANSGTLFLADNESLHASKNDLLLEGNIHYEGTDGTLLDTSSLYWDNALGELRCDTDYVRQKPVEDGLIQIKGKKFRTNKDLTQWHEIGATMKFISTEKTEKEQK